MCDERELDEMIALHNTDLSRRRFGALSLSAGLAMALPRAANAVAVTEHELDIKTPAGVADSYFVHPTQGAHAAVLMWTDIMGLRGAYRQMAKRLAESGYAVLVPNPFYRALRADAVLKAVAEYRAANTNATPGPSAVVMKLAQSLNPTTHTTDAIAFVNWLDAQPAVDRRRKMGAMGYCMGGPMTLRTAAAMPERIGAGGSYHGTRLVTDAPDSPHQLVSTIKASYLFAIAESDDAQDPKAKDALRAAFASARLPAEIEVYAGTRHGWCAIDGAQYHEVQAERAWARTLELFKTALA